jgi:hypothetical protein
MLSDVGSLGKPARWSDTGEAAVTVLVDGAEWRGDTDDVAARLRPLPAGFVTPDASEEGTGNQNVLPASAHP